MAIPDYQTCMLPVLRFLGDGQEHSMREAEEALAEFFKLTPAERAELLPSGQQGIFKNRIGWARTYLKKAGLVETPKRGVSRGNAPRRVSSSQRPPTPPKRLTMRHELTPRLSCWMGSNWPPS